MAVTSTILVYCFLYMAIILIHCDGLRLVGIPNPVYNGARQRLTCYDVGWYADVTFYFDSFWTFAEVEKGFFFRCKLKLFDDDLDEDNFDKSCDWFQRTLIINNVDDRYNNTIWRCKSRGRTSNKFTLKVKDLRACNFNASISGDVSNVVEGNNLHLTCNSNTDDHDDDDDDEYSWTIYSNNGSTITSKEKTIYKTASREDTGMYSCQIKKKDCTGEAQIDIKVQYHPTVSIHSESSNSTINITCIGDGYPDNFTFYGWHHYINDQLVRVLPGNETRGSSILTLDRVTESGKYVCLLSNGIPDKDGNFNSSAESTVELPDHPTVSIHSESNSIINMTCIGDGYPDNFTFYGWHHYINDQLVRVLPGNETQGSSMLTLERVTALDNGKYVCLLSNGIPDKDGNLKFSAASTVKLPATPIVIGNKTEAIDINIADTINMTSVFLTEDVISVKIIAPNDTHKELMVSDVVQEEYRNIKVYGTIVNVSVSVVQYSILNVTKEGHYYFNVCNVYELCDVSNGYNIKFNSKVSEPISGMRDTEEPGQNLPIILGTVAAVVVIMVIVIIVIVVVRRRSSTSKLDNYDHQGNSHSNPVFDDRNVEIIPNDLYHASDPPDNKMEIIPNDLYVPSDPKPVTNFKNMEIIPNELYVSADAETNNLNNVTPDELYVGGETIARNKELQNQIKSGYTDDEKVYMNDQMMHEKDA